MIYLDHNATTPLHPSAFRAMRPYLEGRFGNPASVHGPGREARSAVEAARRRVLSLLDRITGELVFTGSGTEAVLLGMVGSWHVLASRGRHVVVSAIEHPSVIDAARVLEREGASISWVGPDESGRIDSDRVSAAMREDTVLVSVQHANNETGVVHPLREIGERARSSGARFFVDAIQSAGKIPLEIETWQADVVALSAHKLGGPKGVGALWRRETAPLEAVIPGTAERGLRGGTVNVPGVVGFGAAAELAHRNLEFYTRYARTLREQFEAAVSEIPGASVTGRRAERLPNTTHLTFEPEVGPDLVIALDHAGVAVSAGSACTSGSESPSHVLVAMGMTADRARTSVRVSLGAETTPDELDRCAAQLRAIVEKRLLAAGRS